MFRKLEKSFTRYSLLILSLVVLISFLTIYLFVRVNIYRDIHRELDNLGQMLQNNPPQEDRHMKGRAPLAPPPVGFIAIPSGDSVSILTPFEKNQTDIPYEELYKTAVTANRKSGTLSTQSGRWMYQWQADGPLYFVETSRQTRILRNLLGIGFGIYFLMLLVFWFISRQFAKKAVAPAKTAYQKQSEFIANVSHELKTPLAVISTNAEAMSLNPDETIEDNIQWLMNIQKEAKQMNVLLSQMMSLDLSSPSLDITSFDLSSLVQEVILSFEPAIYEKNLSLNLSLPTTYLQTDSNLLRQVLYLLIENAVSYSPVDGKISISLDSVKKAGFSICNSQQGLISGEEEKLFQRFYRGSNIDTSINEGYGLGLPIARQILTSLGGSIEAHIEKNTLCFVVSFKG